VVDEGGVVGGEEVGFGVGHGVRLRRGGRKNKRFGENKPTIYKPA
jgi:hypothetical protein